MKKNNLVKGLLCIGAAIATGYTVYKLKEKAIDKIEDINTDEIKDEIEDKIDTVTNKVDTTVKTACKVIIPIAAIGFIAHTVNQLNALWDAVEALRVSDGMHFFQPKVTNKNEAKAIIEFMLEHANKIEDEQMRTASVEMINSIMKEVR